MNGIFDNFFSTPLFDRIYEESKSQYTLGNKSKNIGNSLYAHGWKEEENRRVLEIKVPGFAKEDISLEYERNEYGEQLIHFFAKNDEYGSMKIVSLVDKNYVLPPEEAKLKNGILKIYLRKVEPQKVTDKLNKIEIDTT